MPNWINFAELRQKVSLEDVIFRLYRLDNLTRHGEKLVGPCPVHGGDSPRAFHADLGKNVWHCFSRCKRGGNQLDFVSLKENISIRDAALKLQAFFEGAEGGCGDPPPSRTPSPSTATGTSPTRKRGETDRRDRLAEQQGAPPLDVKLRVAHDHPHLLADRELELATVRHFGVGYCARGIMRGLIAIPVHDEDGQLVAYAGRRLKPQDIRAYGKYKFPKGFRKELVLYNLHRAREPMADRGLILVEGFFSVLKLYEAGFENAVATMGCEISTRQAEFLAEAPEVVIIFDGNEAGWGGADQAKERLATSTTVRVVRLPEGVEPDDLEPRALRWLVNGMQALNLAEVSFSFTVHDRKEDSDADGAARDGDSDAGG